MTDIRKAVARAICLSLYCEDLENNARVSGVTRELCRETADAAIAAHTEAARPTAPALDPYTLEQVANAVEAHRYEDDFLNTCILRREHRADIAATIRALIPIGKDT